MLAMSENRRDEMEFRREEREREDRRFMSEREDRVRKDLLFLRAFGIDSRESDRNTNRQITVHYQHDEDLLSQPLPMQLTVTTLSDLRRY